MATPDSDGVPLDHPKGVIPMWFGIIFVAVALVLAVLAVVVDSFGKRPRLRYGDKPTKSSTFGRGWKWLGQHRCCGR